MARIEGGFACGRPTDVGFDYVANQDNEPQRRPRMVWAEKITAGLVGNGTQFCSPVASMVHTAEVLSERTGYDRACAVRLHHDDAAASNRDVHDDSKNITPPVAREIVETYVAAPGAAETFDLDPERVGRACVQDALALARITEGCWHERGEA